MTDQPKIRPELLEPFDAILDVLLKLPPEDRLTVAISAVMATWELAGRGKAADMMELAQRLAANPHLDDMLAPKKSKH